MRLFKEILTKDGTLTYFNPEYNQNYHSLVGARREALEKYLYPSKILSSPCVKLLDIGLGLGYNGLVAWEHCNSISIVSLEKDESLLSELPKIHIEKKWESLFFALGKTGIFREEGKKWQLLLGDARKSVRDLLVSEGETFDSIFLDAFSPPTNPELWSLEFFKNLITLLKKGGALLTYSSSLSVITALNKAGFSVFTTQSVGRKRRGLIALKPPINEKENDDFERINVRDKFFLCHSVRALPNIDKGDWEIDKIKNYREKLSEIAVRLGFLLPHKRVEKIWKTKEVLDGCSHFSE